MVALSTTTDMLAALQHARSVSLTAYVLRPGRVLRSLENAATRGARVVVRLEGAPFADTSGELVRWNADAIEALRAHGAQATLQDQDGSRPLHLKAALVDNEELFLDDRNWPDDGMDTIIRDNDPKDVQTVREAMAGRPRNDAPLATQKDPALAREARTIYEAADAHQAIDVQSESFGYGRVTAALLTAADAHVPVRLVVAERDLSARGRSALRKLAQHGVSVRVSQSDEKMAVTADQAWLGSANATMGVENQLDWGLRLFERAMVRSVQKRFNENWDAARPYVDPGQRAPERLHR